MIRVVLQNSNNVIYFNDLYDVLNEEYVNDADIEVVIYDVYGAEVAGQIWPLTLSYNDGSDGDYYAALNDGINLQVGLYYKAVVNIDAGPGRRLEETHELEIVDRLP